MYRRVPGTISTTFEGLAKAVTPGDSLLIADGLVELRVDSTDGREVRTTVVEGGEIGDHKGINAPGVPLPASAITIKDADDLRLGVSLGVDMIALSFVQSVDDIAQARRLLEDAGAPDMPLIAKLERPKALEHLDAILEACDGVMVARGDLGLEMPLEKVPTAQKNITRLARLHGVPVIVATQVLESMTSNRGPRVPKSAMPPMLWTTGSMQSCWPVKPRPVPIQRRPCRCSTRSSARLRARSRSARRSVSA